MAKSARLSGAHAILLATHLCATGNIFSLPQLQADYPTTLTTERLLRIILTFLPESTEPKKYTSVVQALVDGLRTTGNDVVDVPMIKELTEDAARKRVRKIRLLPLRYPGDEDSQDTTDLLTQFLIHRAHRIDSETSLQPLILDLLLPFYQRSPALRTWLVSCLLPLLRLNYEYYPSEDKSCSVETLESLDNPTAANILLSIAGTPKNDTDLIKNLRGLVGPWMYGTSHPRRQKLGRAPRRNSISLRPQDSQEEADRYSGWKYVNEWLLDRSLVDPEAVVNAFINWDGPEDVDLGGYVDELEGPSADQSKELRYRFGQAGLAVIYQSPEIPLDGSIRILDRVASLLGLDESLFITSDKSALPSVEFDSNQIQSASRATLFQNALLLSTNPLTRPSPSSISFLSGLLLSLRALEELGHPIPCRTATNICLHSNQDMQLFELRTVMASVAQQAKSGRGWRQVRQQLLWLRDWKSDTGRPAESNPSCHGLFWRVPQENLEAEILKLLLEVREHNLAIDIYVKSRSTLSPDQVENAVKESVFTAYDNASNGNKTRGKIQRAHEILQAFQPHFPESTSFKQAQALIAATHALSFYSLTLQHGVPFQPVSLRVHPDPLSLLEEVLKQNPKSYTKLDDLLSIGRNLVRAGFTPRPANESDSHSHYTRSPVLTQDEALITAERRVMSLAISSALASNDFGTAYSYILTRLTPPSFLPSSSLSSTSQPPALKDDITWRAVYNAGRYRPPTTPSSPQALHTQITNLTQRMELLSLSLILAPTPDPLPEILGAWRRADEELSLLRARESEEEDLWDTRGGNTTVAAPSILPGGFNQPDTEQDVFETRQHHARRAARAAHHNRLDSEEAPMGLFEVARGAARALHKNVNSLPLGVGGALPSGSSLSSSISKLDSEGEGMGEGWEAENGPGSGSGGGNAQEGERVRKRDVVSNMVTGGLASGIGWVLGAQPVNMNRQ
ncbi:secretory pathway Sec39 family protein [Aspergillus lucknowensis]|uniref:Sec39 domain-containing protein n=1 Tax=Aspergillus lucknowensis TaxID=176173 RepID=A0ABR4LQ81_9EURO